MYVQTGCTSTVFSTRTARTSSNGMYGPVERHVLDWSSPSLFFHFFLFFFAYSLEFFVCFVIKQIDFSGEVTISALRLTLTAFYCKV